MLSILDLMYVLIFAGLVGCATGKPPMVEFLNPGTVLPDGLPFSEAVRVDNTLYLSGLVGVKPGTTALVSGGIEAESMDDVVKCTVMLADISEWSTFNKIYQTYFTDRYPARSALGANGLALGARIEVECIAVVGND